MDDFDELRYAIDEIGKAFASIGRSIDESFVNSISIFRKIIRSSTAQYKYDTPESGVYVKTVFATKKNMPYQKRSYRG